MTGKTSTGILTRISPSKWNPSFSREGLRNIWYFFVLFTVLRATGEQTPRDCCQKIKNKCRIYLAFYSQASKIRVIKKPIVRLERFRRITFSRISNYPTAALSCRKQICSYWSSREGARLLFSSPLPTTHRASDQQQNTRA